MTRPPLDSTLLGTNTTKGTTSRVDSIPVGTKIPEPMPLALTLRTYFLEQNGRVDVAWDPYQEPSSSDSSSKKSNSSKDSSSIKSIKKKHNKKKGRQKHKKQDMSDSLSSDSDSTNNSYYRRKRCKKKSHKKTDPIKLCARLTAKLITTAYKSNIIRFKLDEDPLQRRIYFLVFVESLNMIFSQYKETCEVLLDYPKIGGENIL